MAESVMKHHCNTDKKNFTLLKEEYLKNLAGNYVIFLERYICEEYVYTNLRKL